MRQKWKQWKEVGQLHLPSWNWHNSFPSTSGNRIIPMHRLPGQVQHLLTIHLSQGSGEGKVPSKIEVQVTKSSTHRASAT